LEGFSLALSKEQIGVRPCALDVASPTVVAENPVNAGGHFLSVELPAGFH